VSPGEGGEALRCIPPEGETGDAGGACGAPDGPRPRLAPERSHTYLQAEFQRSGKLKGYAMNLLWGLVVVLVVLWLLGFSMHVGGGLIHLLLVVAVIVIIVRLVSGRGV
jgi:hypothetical protein